jgi:hypothetical protein
MRYLDVFDKHDHLFLRDEAFEIVPRLAMVVGQDLRDHPIPKDTTCNGEEILHEVALRSHLHLDGAFAQTGRSAGGDIEAVSLHSSHGIFKRDKLDVGVHCLAGHLVHNDMHAFVRVIQDFGIATEKGNNLGASRGERNLGSNISKTASLYMAKRRGKERGKGEDSRGE